MREGFIFHSNLLNHNGLSVRETVKADGSIFFLWSRKQVGLLQLPSQSFFPMRL